MKRDEVREIFPNATDEEIDSILNKFSSELNPLKKRAKEAEDARDQALNDLDSTKTALDAANEKITANMTDEQRLAAREQAAAEKEQEFLLKSNALEAKSIFVECGYFDADVIDKLVEQVLVSDVEQTKSRAKMIVETIKKQRETVETATRDAMLKDNPKLNGAGGGGTPTTKEEFLKLSLTDQIALKEANPGILSQLK